MKWNILHESRGRIRLHLRKPRMSLAEADQLQDYLTSLPGVRTAAIGARFAHARRRGVIEAVGYITSTDPGTHAHPVRQWQGAHR